MGDQAARPGWLRPSSVPDQAAQAGWALSGGSWRTERYLAATGALRQGLGKLNGQARERGKPRAWTDRGSAVVTGVLAIAFLLSLFVAGVNFVLDEYAKGALHAAVDEAAQAGASAGGSLGACQAEADRVRANLLPGPFGSRVTITCRMQGDLVVASASGALPSMVPVVPSLTVALTGISVVERAPVQ
ncbi:MAG: hypothetical protein ACP5VR_01575 [Acidimicrobiales bacterium]